MGYQFVPAINGGPAAHVKREPWQLELFYLTDLSPLFWFFPILFSSENALENACSEVIEMAIL